MVLRLPEPEDEAASLLEQLRPHATSHLQAPQRGYSISSPGRAQPQSTLDAAVLLGGQANNINGQLHRTAWLPVAPGTEALMPPSSEAAASKLGATALAAAAAQVSTLSRGTFAGKSRGGPVGSFPSPDSSRAQRARTAIAALASLKPLRLPSAAAAAARAAGQTATGLRTPAQAASAAAQGSPQGPPKDPAVRPRHQSEAGHAMISDSSPPRSSLPLRHHTSSPSQTQQIHLAAVHPPGRQAATHRYTATSASASARSSPSPGRDIRRQYAHDSEQYASPRSPRYSPNKSPRQSPPRKLSPGPLLFRDLSPRHTAHLLATELPLGASPGAAAEAAAAAAGLPRAGSPSIHPYFHQPDHAYTVGVGSPPGHRHTTALHAPGRRSDSQGSSPDPHRQVSGAFTWGNAQQGLRGQQQQQQQQQQPAKRAEGQDVGTALAHERLHQSRAQKPVKALGEAGQAVPRPGRRYASARTRSPARGILPTAAAAPPSSAAHAGSGGSSGAAAPWPSTNLSSNAAATGSAWRSPARMPAGRAVQGAGLLPAGREAALVTYAKPEARAASPQHHLQHLQRVALQERVLRQHQQQLAQLQQPGAEPLPSVIASFAFPSSLASESSPPHLAHAAALQSLSYQLRHPLQHQPQPPHIASALLHEAISVSGDTGVAHQRAESAERLTAQQPAAQGDKGASTLSTLLGSGFGSALLEDALGQAPMRPLSPSLAPAVQHWWQQAGGTASSTTSSTRLPWGEAQPRQAAGAWAAKGGQDGRAGGAVQGAAAAAADEGLSGAFRPGALHMVSGPHLTPWPSPSGALPCQQPMASAAAGGAPYSHTFRPHPSPSWSAAATAASARAHSPTAGTAIIPGQTFTHRSPGFSMPDPASTARVLAWPGPTTAAAPSASGSPVGRRYANPAPDGAGWPLGQGQAGSPNRREAGLERHEYSVAWLHQQGSVAVVAPGQATVARNSHDQPQHQQHLQQRYVQQQQQQEVGLHNENGNSTDDDEEGAAGSREEGAAALLQYLLYKAVHARTLRIKSKVFSAWREALASKEGEAAEGAVSLSTGIGAQLEASSPPAYRSNPLYDDPGSAVHPRPSVQPAAAVQPGMQVQDYAWTGRSAQPAAGMVDTPASAALVPAVPTSPAGPRLFAEMHQMLRDMEGLLVQPQGTGGLALGERGATAATAVATASSATPGVDASVVHGLQFGAGTGGGAAEAVAQALHGGLGPDVGLRTTSGGHARTSAGAGGVSTAPEFAAPSVAASNSNAASVTTQLSTPTALHGLQQPTLVLQQWPFAAPGATSVAAPTAPHARMDAGPGVAMLPVAVPGLAAPGLLQQQQYELQLLRAKVDGLERLLGDTAAVAATPATVVLPQAAIPPMLHAGGGRAAAAAAAVTHDAASFVNGQGQGQYMYYSASPGIEGLVLQAVGGGAMSPATVQGGGASREASPPTNYQHGQRQQVEGQGQTHPGGKTCGPKSRSSSAPRRPTPGGTRWGGQATVGQGEARSWKGGAVSWGLLGPKLRRGSAGAGRRGSPPGARVGQGHGGGEAGQQQQQLEEEVQRELRQLQLALHRRGRAG